MNQAYWQNKWAADDIQFHNDTVHPGLQKYFKMKPGGRLFVPLCGKSKDLLWLAHQGCFVVGSELSEKACHAFFDENKLPYSQSSTGAFTKFTSNQIEIWCGDHLALPLSVFAGVSGWYDRAALVALPEDMRQNYVKHFLNAYQLCNQEEFTMLLITYEYEQMKVSGPPFSVTADEIHRLYGKQLHIQQLNRNAGPSLNSHPRFKEVPTTEVIYQLDSRI